MKNYIKKTMLIGIAFGIASLAQANSLTLVPGYTYISGYYAYLYQFTPTSLGLSAGQAIDNVQLNFDQIQLRSSDARDTMISDVIDANINPPYYNSYYDGDQAGDYFTTSTFKTAHPGVNINNLGTENFSGIYDTESWLYNLSSTELNNDLSTYGGFNIGIDPDCNYKVKGSITLTYDIVTPPSPPSVPDTGMTAALLGMSFAGLLLFRRKLVLN